MKRHRDDTGVRGGMIDLSEMLRNCHFTITASE